MISTPILQQATGSSTTQIVNILGVGLILAYGVAHYMMKTTDDPDEERMWRRRSAGLLAGFAFYAVIMAAFGPRGSWVTTIGHTIETNVEQFATEMATLGGQSETEGDLGRVINGIKILGLVAYAATVGVLAVSGSIARQIAGYIRSILP